jgi:hypothetical protein
MVYKYLADYGLYAGTLYPAISNHTFGCFSGFPVIPHEDALIVTVTGAEVTVSTPVAVNDTSVSGGVANPDPMVADPTVDPLGSKEARAFRLE